MEAPPCTALSTSLLLSSTTFFMLTLLSAPDFAQPDTIQTALARLFAHPSVFLSPFPPFSSGPGQALTDSRKLTLPLPSSSVSSIHYIPISPLPHC
ncbi:uncharacterized protein B0T23DRAFT_128033 [Neurospora hispaniola]|uniref:Uncharacterized protein n=1 Tax=Neurospora hispaniola TaxID=588809 RepID=A0AAJ0MT88_9PEZI|nr:hypothetical protein B0T23DRAFT_128033 [Neurospora hispaniola]